MAQGIQVDFLLAGVIDQTNGLPLNGGKVTTQKAGTTDPLTTFTDVNLTTPHTNPIILSSQGKATVFVANEDVKFVITDSADVAQETIDNLHYVRFNPNSVNRNQRTITAGVTLDPLTDDMIFADAGTGSMTIVLPPAAQANVQGKEYIVKKIDATANTVTIDPNAAELIEGVATLVLNDENESVTFRSDATNWRVIIGSGTGIDADTLDGLNSTQFIRSDVDDDISGNLNFDNNKTLFGKDIGGTDRPLIKVSASDTVEIASAALPADINTSSTTNLTHNGNKIFDAANDGSGSGLDADKFDALESNQFLRSDVGDQADAIIIFAANPTLKNNVALIGTEADTTTLRNLATITAADRVQFGDVNNELRLQGTLIKFSDGTVSDIIHERDQRCANVHGRITGAGALTGGFGISGVLRNGAGDYTVSFTNAMADANYGIAIEAVNNFTKLDSGVSPTTTAVRYQTTDSSSGPIDAEHFITLVGALA